MFIMDTIRSTVGLISIEQKGDPQNPVVRISGLSGNFIVKDMDRVYKTTRVGKHMFNKIGGSYVELPAFFCLELARHLEESLVEGGYRYVSRRTTRQVLDALYEGTWLAKTQAEPSISRFNYKKLEEFVYQPLAYQRTWLEKFEKVNFQMMLNGTILDAAAGSGKTYMGLYVAELSECDHVFVVSPKNALDRVWRSTIQEHIKSKPSVWVSDQREQYNGEKYIVCHYEALPTALHIAGSKEMQGKKICVIIDESHNFNEINSSRTQRVIDLCKITKSEFIIPQSGTPFKAIGSEIVPVLFMIDPTFNQDLASRFKKIYSESAKEALLLLSYRLGLISHRVEKHELGLDKPEILAVKVPVPNGNDFTLKTVGATMEKFVAERATFYEKRQKEDHGEYFRILGEFTKSVVGRDDKVDLEQYNNDVKTIRAYRARECPDELIRANKYEKHVIIPMLSKADTEIFKEVKTIYKYVHLKIQGECLGRVLGRARMDCAIAVASHINLEEYIEQTEKKTLVYTMYVQALEAGMAAMEKKGYKPVAVYAKTNSYMSKTIADFEKDAGINPLFATFHSLSTAVPLTMADMVVMMDVPFRDYILNQTISRINRLGATTKPRIRICELDTGKEPNLSSRTIDILKWSQSQLKRMGFDSPYPITEEQFGTEAMSSNDGFKGGLNTDFEDLFMRPYV